MLTEYLNHWLLFTLLFSLLLLVSFMMMQQSNHFYTYDVIERKFTILELEMPATPTELHNLITGIYHLPPAKSRRSLQALRGQLWIDFLFMPLAYGCIFLLCWRVAGKMSLPFGQVVFWFLAFGQIIPWICDIVENIFLLSQLKKNAKKMKKTQHRKLLYMEALKWGLALTAFVCAMSAMAYFWCTGNYSSRSLQYLLIIVAECAVFAIAVALFGKQKMPAGEKSN